MMEEKKLNSVLCVGNTYFELKNLQKYNRVAKDQDGVEVKSMKDMVLVKKRYTVLYAV